MINLVDELKMIGNFLFWMTIIGLAVASAISGKESLLAIAVIAAACKVANKIFFEW